MSVAFKTKKIKDEWDLLDTQKPYMKGIVEEAVALADKQFDMDLTITHILRDRDTQLRFYPKHPNRRSVHEFWRGIDIRSRDLTTDEIDSIVSHINGTYPYRGGKFTAMHHDIKGPHIHIQTPDGLQQKTELLNGARPEVIIDKVNYEKLTADLSIELGKEKAKASKIEKEYDELVDKYDALNEKHENMTRERNALMDFYNQVGIANEIARRKFD